MDTSEKYIKMCSSTKEIQRKWRFGSGDFVYDPDFEEVRALLYYPVGESTEYVWLPRQDQLQEICLEFFMRNMDMSEYESFVHLSGSYASWLKQIHNIIWNVGGGYKDVDSFEELMLLYAMEMLHGKKWDGENWINAYKGYEPKEGSDLYINRNY